MIHTNYPPQRENPKNKMKLKQNKKKNEIQIIFFLILKFIYYINF
jgi:hypothetical protein